MSDRIRLTITTALLGVTMLSGCATSLPAQIDPVKTERVQTDLPAPSDSSRSADEDIAALVTGMMEAMTEGVSTDDFWIDGKEQWTLKENYQFHLIDYVIEDRDENQARVRLWFALQPRPDLMSRSAVYFARLVRDGTKWKISAVSPTR